MAEELNKCVGCDARTDEELYCRFCADSEKPIKVILVTVFQKSFKFRAETMFGLSVAKHMAVLQRFNYVEEYEKNTSVKEAFDWFESDPVGKKFRLCAIPDLEKPPKGEVGKPHPKIRNMLLNPDEIAVHVFLINEPEPPTLHDAVFNKNT